MTDGFVFDSESCKLYHEPCGKVTRAESRDADAIERLQDDHVCEGHNWAGLDDGFADHKYGHRGTHRPRRA